MLRKIRKNKTVKNLNIVFIEMIISRGISLVIFILLARALGPEQYGVYSLITVSILFLVSFLDFGVENIAVRFSGRYENERENIFGLYFLSKSVIISIVLLLFVLMPDLVPKLLNKPQVQKYLFIIFIGFVIESYRFILVSYFQSMEKFFVRAWINIVTFSLRLIVIFYLVTLSADSVKTISLVFAFSGLPAICFFFHKFIDFAKALVTSKKEKSMLVEMLSYGKWIILAALPMQLMIRLDFYIVTRFSTYEDMGIYQSAVQLISLFSFIPFVFGTVLLPKVSKYRDFERIKLFVKKTLTVGIPITILFLGMIPLSEFLVALFLGEKYMRSAPIFQILLLSFSFRFWNVLLGTVFYSLGKANYMALGAYIQLILFAVSALILVPKLMLYGVAWSRVIGSAASSFVIIFFLYKVMREANVNVQDEVEGQ